MMVMVMMVKDGDGKGGSHGKESGGYSFRMHYWDTECLPAHLFSEVG
jgi:hypothetical protein